MTRSFFRWFLPLMVLVLAFWMVGDASACPNCKEALASQSGDAARLQDGYTYSILFMMAMPFILFGTGAFFVFRAVRRGSLPEL